jgi:hypothetical protein
MHVDLALELTVTDLKQLELAGVFAVLVCLLQTAAPTALFILAQNVDKFVRLSGLVGIRARPGASALLISWAFVLPSTHWSFGQ